MKVSNEQATKEVNEWLDTMDVPTDNRSSREVKPFIDSLVDSVCKGFLIIDGDVIKQVLKFPLGDGATTEITYDFRFEIGDYKKATKGISPSDEVDFCVARLSLVSEKKYPKDVFLKLKRADYNVAKALTVFF